jgi:hypothetical protein
MEFSYVAYDKDRRLILKESLMPAMRAQPIICLVQAVIRCTALKAKHLIKFRKTQHDAGERQT